MSKNHQGTPELFLNSMMVYSQFYPHLAQNDTASELGLKYNLCEGLELLFQLVFSN